MWASRGFPKALECEGQRGPGRKKVHCMMGVVWMLQWEKGSKTG